LNAIKGVVANLVERMDLGICIPCYTGDLDLLYGCVQSIRHFYPDVPVCLIPHGNPPIKNFAEKYGLQIIRRESVHPSLANLSYGYGLTKMIAFWHSPYKHFWHIDPDTIMLGRPLDFSKLSQGKFICNNPHETVTRSILEEQYFSPERVPSAYKNFIPSSEELFNSGVFFSERGLLDLAEYLDIIKFMSSNPGSIFMDQGILNLMVSRLKRQKGLVVERRPLQTVVAVTPLDRLEALWSAERFQPGQSCSANTVIHWAGRKPRLTEGGPFCDPMSYFRLKQFGLEKGMHQWWANAVLAAQEIYFRFLLRAERSHRTAKVKKFFNW
jgi:hypothetical protein